MQQPALSIYVHARYFEGRHDVHFGRYPNGRLAIRLRQDGEPACTATTNPDPSDAQAVSMEEREIALKGWSENEGLPESLIASGLFVDTGRSVKCGHVRAKIVTITGALQDALDQWMKHQAAA